MHRSQSTSVKRFVMVVHNERRYIEMILLFLWEAVANW